MHEQNELVESERREDENNEVDVGDGLKSQLESKNKENEELKKELERIKKENEELNKKLKDKIKEYEKLERDFREKEREIEIIKNEMIKNKDKGKDKENEKIMDNKENESFNKIIEQMKNKIKVLELEKQIEEIRNRKEQKRKKEEEKKIMELINNHNKTVEDRQNQIENLKLNFLYNQIMSSIETIMQKQNNNFNNRIKKFEEEILSNNKINIDENKSQIIQKIMMN